MAAARNVYLAVFIVTSNAMELDIWHTDRDILYIINGFCKHYLVQFKYIPKLMQ
jgi:hypothetical protein